MAKWSTRLPEKMLCVGSIPTCPFPIFYIFVFYEFLKNGIPTLL